MLRKRSLFYPLLALLGLFSSCSRLAFSPSPWQYYTPAQFNAPYESHSFKAADGEVLNAWFIPGAGPERERPFIVFFHGNAQNISTHFLSFLWAQKKGIDLFIFDYREMGLSTGEVSAEGVSLDALAALNFARNLQKERKLGQMSVYGQSLGGHIALGALQKWEHTKEVKHLILDSTFWSLKEAGSRVLRKSWLLWAFSPLSYLLLSDSMGAKGRKFYFPGKTLVIHSHEDQIIPFDLGESLYQRVEGEKEFWALEKGKHIQTFSGPNEKVRLRLWKYLR